MDIAVHRTDQRKLGSVFLILRQKGYIAVQVINYFVDAYCFRFLWFEPGAINSASLDVISNHQRGFLFEPSIDLLLSGRRKQGLFWVPSAEGEFSYLIAKKTCKGAISASQKRRLKALVEHLGRDKAEGITGRFFAGRLKVNVVDACVNGELDSLIVHMKKQALTMSVLRSPLRFTKELVRNGARLLRRWSKPSGLMIVLMGPDGAGKSTLLQHMLGGIGPAFRHHAIFHWRPMLVWKPRVKRDSTQPHSLPQRGPGRSASQLLGYVVDYWLGYWFAIRPHLTRCGLVVFDRYFDDMMIDPKRYRYGGPLWLIKLLRPFVFKPDLLLVLDAPPEILLSRKQEITSEELQRQRELYSRHLSNKANSHVIDTTGSIKQVADRSAEVIIDFLAQRFERWYPSWAWSRAAFDDHNNS